MKNDNLILAPNGTTVLKGSKVLIVTEVRKPLVAIVMHINHNQRCSLVCDNGETLERYTLELHPLMEDTTSTVGEIIQKSGDGKSQYDWVKTIVTTFEPKKFEIERIISFDEYKVKKNIQDFKAKLSIQHRSEFNDVMKEWGEFNKNEAEQSAAENAAGADI